ncbi:MAG TPA: TrbG/VirB9 family P-type conjugative transfer protein [Blastocatellia bacterium]|nr:TrbG/VirB9 family P-type conjugative transfer protein [Blastocatellia bacterium]
MKIKRAIAISALLLAAAPIAPAQSLIKTATLAPDQIGLVKSAMGITTRISFPETVKEVVCGDLYDPASGKGSFVVQRSENDVYLKPVVSKALSNLFVRTGENGDHVYSFDLTVVPVEQAYRIFFVKSATIKSPQAQPSAEAAKSASQAEEIIRAARQQAEQITAQAQQRAAETNQQAANRADHEVALRFSRALILGLRETKIGNARTFARGATIALDPRAYAFDGKVYLRYTIQNSRSDDFVYSTLSLETGSGGDRKTIAIEVTQSRTDNRITPGQTVTGVIVFDQKEAPQLDKLTLYLRGEENAEIGRVVISR